MREDLRTAIYARVSSERQAGDSTIASQIAALEARVSADGLVLVPERPHARAALPGCLPHRPHVHQPVLHDQRPRVPCGQHPLPGVPRNRAWLVAGLARLHRGHQQRRHDCRSGRERAPHLLARRPRGSLR